MWFFRNTDQLFLPIKEQLRNWRRANRKMKWGIKEDEFKNIEKNSFDLEFDDQHICGSVLSYGFGDDGCGNADAVLSGRMIWQYAVRKWKHRTWQCQYIEFRKQDYIRLYPQAPQRPKGFYHCTICIPKKVQQYTVAQFRKDSGKKTGLGPEGLQLLIITHPHLQQALNTRKLPCLSFADYDVAPYGHFDFYDAVQMFCSNNTLGLGIGNIDQNYPMFAIPYMQYQS